MALSEQDILRVLMKSRDRIAAAAWVVVRDAQAAEDIFQNVAIKAMTKEVSFDAEGAVLSWGFTTARREGIDWVRRHRNEMPVLDAEILVLLERDWLTESQHEDSRTEALRNCLRELPQKSGEIPNWHGDGLHVIRSMPVEGMEGNRFVQARYDGKDFRILSETLEGGGHPSVEPQGKYLITDKRHDQDGVALMGLRLIDLTANEERRVCDMPTIMPSVARPTRLCSFSS